MGAFKAYDIRGVFGRDFDLDTVYRIGRWLPSVLTGRRALVGRDVRLTSGAIREALCRGLCEAGCDVDDVGLATTPMVYFATARGDYDLSVQITASHNPPDCNGLKISRRGARPVGYETGLAELERRVGRPELPPRAAAPGTCRTVSTQEAFLDFLRPWQPAATGLRVAVDCSDGMAGLVARRLFGPATRYLFDQPDGRFPHHAPNPLDPANSAALAACVRTERLDVGVLFDGDADRVTFVDETGAWVRPDLMIALLGYRFLRSEPGATILCDIRTSRGVVAALRAAGARTAMWKVGHAYAKAKLRELGAVFGGELAGHYYFRDFFCCDSGELAALVALGELAAARKRGVAFSALLAPIDCFANSGELNFEVVDKDAAVRAVRADTLAQGTPTAVLDFDGYRIEFPDWWICVRSSNTEPLVRLILEAREPALLADRRARAEAVLRPYLAAPATGA